MNRTPAQQWSALSALYEEADGLGARELAAFLARLEGEGNELLPQLRRMLEARAHMETDDFLSTMPRLSTEAQAATSWSPGRRVGPYKLVRPLGEGGMAEVWLAERDDGAFKRQVAIKLPYPKPGRETFAVRFDRERDILATLRHPNIAGLFDAGVTAEGQAWLALEYVEGQPISVFCDERRLSVRERVQLFRQVLLAVQHAHANLVIHRDLKPANILVTLQGEVRLLDFGIAKLLEAEGDAVDETELTRQAGRSMTPRYASPEQIMGLPLTTASDIYSLGVVLYELLCGERPYELKVDSPAQLEHAILDAEVREPSRRATSEPCAQARGVSAKALKRVLSSELDAITLRCLEKTLSARYASIDALLADMDRWLTGEPVLARAPSAWYRTVKFASRHRIGVSLGALSLSALVATTIAAVMMGLKAREESARATAARDFMVGLFQRANEEKARGADITARDVLETGRKDLNERLSGEPRLQAELLLEIGRIQAGMGEYVNAESTFSDAASLYRSLSVPRDESLAKAHQADAALRMGNAARARALLNQARAIQGTTSDPKLSSYLDLVDGGILTASGDARSAKQALISSWREAATSYGPTHEQTIRAIRGLVFAERHLLEFDSALAHHAELERLFRSEPRKSRTVGVQLDSDKAELLQHAGKYAANVRHVASALPLCEKELGLNDERCRRLLLAGLHSRMRLRTVPPTAAEVTRLDAIVDDHTSPALRADALVVALRWASVQQDMERLRLVTGKVVALGESGKETTLNPALKVRALMLVAESRLMRRDPAGAEQWLERAKQVWTQHSAGPMPPVLEGVAKSLRAVADLQQGRYQDALDQARATREQLAIVFGQRHSMFSTFALNEASALERLDRPDEALAIVSANEPVLEEAFESDAPIVLQVRRIKTRLESILRGRGRDNAVDPQPVDFFI